tara:strand:+ start:353 stop:1009 length:657 start_codon:yes stop_codon:yes gene_type:complete
MISKTKKNTCGGASSKSKNTKTSTLRGMRSPSKKTKTSTLKGMRSLSKDTHNTLIGLLMKKSGFTRSEAMRHVKDITKEYIALMMIGDIESYPKFVIPKNTNNKNNNNNNNTNNNNNNNNNNSNKNKNMNTLTMSPPTPPRTGGRRLNKPKRKAKKGTKKKSKAWTKRPTRVRSHTNKRSVGGTMLHKTKAMAESYASKHGLSGSHKMGNRWMAGSTH